MKWFPMWAVALATLSGSTSAFAVVLPAGYQIQAPSPTIDVNVQTSGTPVSGVATQNPTQDVTVHAPGSQSVSGVSSLGAAAPGTAEADGVINYGPSPNISVHVKVEPTGLTPAGVQQAIGQYWGNNYAGAGIQLYYFMAISGPTSTVNLNVSALLGANSSTDFSYGNATATFYVQKQNAGDYVVNDKVFFDPSIYNNANATGSAATGFVGQYAESGVYAFETGQVYVIGMTARTTVTRYGSNSLLQGVEEASAYVDPTFSIASNVPNASEYQIILSQGIGNSGASPVPEPSTWILVLAGLGCIGAARRSSCSGSPRRVFGPSPDTPW